MANVRQIHMFEQSICDALGVKAEGVRRIEILMVPGDATVTVTEFLLTDGTAQEIERVFKMAEWREEVA